LTFSTVTQFLDNLIVAILLHLLFCSLVLRMKLATRPLMQRTNNKEMNWTDLNFDVFTAILTKITHVWLAVGNGRGTTQENNPEAPICILTDDCV
jgi:hypothetical protein